MSRPAFSLTLLTLCATLYASAPTRHTYSNRGRPWPIPGVIEAENFDEGTVSDPAYHDDSPGSAAPSDERYREGDVDIGVDPIMHLADVGWVDVGEWLEYTVVVKQSGRYRIAVRIATPKTGTHFHFEMDSADVTGSVSVPNTGCWGSDLHGHHCFKEATVANVSLKSGVHRLRFVPEGAAGEKNLFTVDKFRFEKQTAPQANSAHAPERGTNKRGTQTDSRAENT